MREMKFIFQLMTYKFMHISTISVISVLHYMNNYKLIKRKAFFEKRNLSKYY